MRETVLLSLLVIKLMFLITVSCHQAVNPLTDNAASQHGHQHHRQQQQQHPAAQHHQSAHGIDRNAVQNQQHIMEDLEGQIKKPTDEMTPEEMQFHYFKVHDYNNDNKLDGIELISALTHHNAENSDKFERMPDRELEKLVDGILDDNDGNLDGFIDYPEFLLSQR